MYTLKLVAMSNTTNFSIATGQNNSNPHEKASLVFHGLLENCSSKILIFGLALPLTLLGELLNSGGIWYDYYTSNTYKTLVHRISTAIAWTALIMIPLLEVLDAMPFLVGPLPEQYCLFTIIFRNTIKTQILLFGNFFIVTRYAFIFHLKNPFALKDQFCITFICLWNFMFSFIYSFVFFDLPGKKPFIYYICADIDPSSDSNLPSQINIYIEAFSLVLHLALNTRIKLYKRANAALTEHQNSQETKSHLISLDEKTITNLTTTASAIIIFVTYMALNFRLMSLSLTKINSYPTNMFVIVNTLLGPVILTILINTVYFVRTPKLSKCLWQELRKHF